MLSRMCCLKRLYTAKVMRQYYMPFASAATCKTKVSKLEGTSIKRDLVNFPRPMRLEECPPVVLGVIPKSWFDFFYNKTGVTGGYTFLFGLSIYLFSKEWLVVDSEMILALVFISTCTSIPRLVPEIRQFTEKMQKENVIEMNSQQEKDKNDVRNEMEELKKLKWQMEGLTSLIPETKRENVHLQQEAIFRMYMKEAHLAVLNVLNYNVQKDTIERLFRQKHLTSWILKSIEAAITPDVKKIALERAISDLKALTEQGGG